MKAPPPTLAFGHVWIAHAEDDSSGFSPRHLNWPGGSWVNMASTDDQFRTHGGVHQGERSTACCVTVHSEVKYCWLPAAQPADEAFLGHYTCVTT